MSPSARTKYLPTHGLRQEAELLSARLCGCGKRARYQPALWVGMGLIPLHRVPISIQVCKPCRKKLDDRQLAASIWVSKVKDLKFGPKQKTVPFEECHLVWERC